MKIVILVTFEANLLQNWISMLEECPSFTILCVKLKLG